MGFGCELFCKFRVQSSRGKWLSSPSRQRKSEHLLHKSETQTPAHNPPYVEGADSVGLHGRVQEVQGS